MGHVYLLCPVGVTLADCGSLSEREDGDGVIPGWQYRAGLRSNLLLQPGEQKEKVCP